MLNSFYTAAAGVVSMQRGLDVAANNIANLSTAGFKADKPSFIDLLNTSVKAAGGGNEGFAAGHGVKLDKTDTVFEQGALIKTGRESDFALTDKSGFFAVLSESGVLYTRDGSFHLSHSAGTKEDSGILSLVNAQGWAVLDEGGRPVFADAGRMPLKIGVFGFHSKDGLHKAGGNYFIETELSGTAEIIQNPAVLNGYLESSSVNLGAELTQVMADEKAFKLNAKIVQTSDEIMQTLLSLR